MHGEWSQRRAPLVSPVTIRYFELITPALVNPTRGPAPRCAHSDRPATRRGLNRLLHQRLGDAPVQHHPPCRSQTPLHHLADHVVGELVALHPRLLQQACPMAGCPSGVATRGRSTEWLETRWAASVPSRGGRGPREPERGCSCFAATRHASFPARADRSAIPQKVTWQTAGGPRYACIAHMGAAGRTCAPVRLAEDLIQGGRAGFGVGTAEAWALPIVGHYRLRRYHVQDARAVLHAAPVGPYQWARPCTENCADAGQDSCLAGPMRRRSTHEHAATIVSG
jgi:hypothetical protein